MVASKKESKVENSVPEKQVEKPKEEKKELQPILTEFHTQINKWGDIHFRKQMLDSLKLTSKIEQYQALKMSFKPGMIVITKA